MRRRSPKLPWLLIALGLIGPIASPVPGARAESAIRSPYAEVAYDQKLGETIPLDLAFRDESGATVHLSDFFGRGRPVILTLVYYRCPMLCNQVLNGVTRSLLPLSLDLGEDFEIVTVSFDPTETPALAKAKKAGYVRRYGREGAGAGWHFLTGDAGPIKALADAVGFRYHLDPKSKQYAHAAGITVLTPEARVIRYFFGIEYPARDLQLGLVDASAGRVGSPIDQILLYCYHYDPATGKYNFAIMGLIRVLGIATVLALATFMFVMFRRDRLRAAATTPVDDPAVGPDRPESTSSH